jgi:hypothetical protein
MNYKRLSTSRGAWIAAAACWFLLGAAPFAQAQSTDEETEPPAAPTAAAADADSATEPGVDPAAAPEWHHRRPAPSGVDARLAQLSTDLHLDAGQQERIKPILVAQREEAQRLMRDATLKPADRQKRLLALGDRSSEQIRAQLTDAQREQYIKPRTVQSTANEPPRIRRGATKPPKAGTKPARTDKP